MKFLIVVLTLIFSLPTFADKGWDAYNEGDYKTAFDEWKVLAEQGDSYAQNNLGVMYDNGQGRHKIMFKHICGGLLPLLKVILMRGRSEIQLQRR